MNLGPCSQCGGPLAPEQRYCLNCGQRTGPPLALPYLSGAAAGGATAAAAGGASVAAGATAGSLSWLPMPAQAVTTFAALALGFGVVVGTALSPNVQNLLAAPTQVAQAPPAEPEPAAPAPSGGGGGAAPDAAPSSDVFGSTGSTVGSAGGGDGGGGGGGSKKPAKEKPKYATGTVVHLNPIARSYTISSGGGLSSIHAVSLPEVGKTVKVPVVQLANRTYSEDGKRQIKNTATQATFAGVVTDNRDSTDPGIPDTYTVSARGSSILVHSPADPTALETPPAIGKLVTTTVEIRNSGPTPMPNDPSLGSPTCPPSAMPLPDPALSFPKELHQISTGSLVVDPAPGAAATEIETVIQSLCPGTPGELLLSSDDVREGKTDVLLQNGGIDLAKLSTGSPMVASVTIVDDVGPPGTKKLGAVTGVTSDAGEGGADSTSSAQGDLRSAAISSARAARRTDRAVARAYERSRVILAARAARSAKRARQARSAPPGG